MDDAKAYKIYPARHTEDIEAAKHLFTAYKASLSMDLTFQNYDAEFAAMPGNYAPPTGELLLAHDAQGVPIACVGLRPLEPEGCEMKRLFVTPAGRGDRGRKNSCREDY
jgi:hypothetical protein